MKNNAFSTRFEKPDIIETKVNKLEEANKNISNSSNPVSLIKNIRKNKHLVNLNLNTK